MVKRALMEDGWICRSTIIWDKPNAMPNSQQDRPTTSHEYIFLLSKRERYFYDAEAIREPTVGTTPHDRPGGRDAPPGQPPHTGSRKPLHGQTYSRYRASGEGGQDRRAAPDGSRTKRSVWRVPTQPFKDAHFAVFPPKLLVPMIQAGTSEMGVCADCGAPWRRVVKASGSSWEARKAAGHDPRGYHVGDNTSHPAGNAYVGASAPTGVVTGGLGWAATKRTIGWQPTCRCGTTERQPAVVLDCFAGSGTTLLTAVQLGRDAIGIDLNSAYLALAARRLAADRPLLTEVDTR